MLDKRYLLLVVTLVGLLTPIYFEVGSLLLTPARVVFLVTVPAILILHFASEGAKVTTTDVLVVAYLAWMTLAVGFHNPGVVLTFAGSNILMILGGYITGRYCVRTSEDFIRLIKTLGFTVVCMLPLALYESLNPNERVTPNMFIPSLLESLGLKSEKDVLYGPRFGLDRAQVVFPHPIHFGLYCTLCFSLILVGLKDRVSTWFRYLWAFLVFVCCFLSVSSGPFLALMVQFLLVMFERTTRWLPKRWQWLLGLLGCIFLVLEVVTDRPIILVLVMTLSFASHTANVRWVLLDYGLAQVWRTPILGIGYYQNYGLPTWMSGSVDNMWLLAALTYGIPALVFMLGAFLMPIWKMASQNTDRESHVYALRNAWMFTLVSIVITLSTVAVWNQLYSLIFLVLGSGVWMLHRREEFDEDDSDDGSIEDLYDLELEEVPS